MRWQTCSTLVAMLLLAGCGSPKPHKPKPTPTHSPTRKAVSVTPRAEMSLSNLRLSQERGGTPSAVFPADARELTLSFTSENIPKGTILRSVWTCLNGTLHCSDSLQAGGSDSFSVASPAGGWPAGEYQIELFIGSQRKQVLTFRVEAVPPKPVPPARRPRPQVTPARPRPQPTPARVDDSSLSNLAHSLCPAHLSQREKALSIYKWVAEHISYDVPAFRSHNYGDMSAEAVLRSRKGVCAGYANLYEALAKEAGLEVEVVGGFAKGVDQGVGESEDKPNHAWNAVNIDGQWYLLDSTWGAGSIDAERFHARYTDYFFQTPPEQFIYTHFPEDPRWQLLPKQLSRAEFWRKPKVSSRFFDYKLVLLSHDQASIETDAKVEVQIGVPMDVSVNANVMDGDHPIEGSALVSRQGDRVTIQAVFPRSGDFKLVLYVAHVGEEILHDAVTYRVHARRGTRLGGFPRPTGDFASREVQLATPLQGELTLRPTEFRLSARGAERMMVEVGDSQHELTKVGTEFHGTVPLAGGKVLVFAMYDRGRWTGLLSYQAK